MAQRTMSLDDLSDNQLKRMDVVRDMLIDLSFQERLNVVMATIKGDVLTRGQNFDLEAEFDYKGEQFVFKLKAEVVDKTTNEETEDK